MPHLFSDANINIRIRHTQIQTHTQSVNPVSWSCRRLHRLSRVPVIRWSRGQCGRRGWRLIPGFRPSPLTEAQTQHTETCRWRTGKSIHSLRLRWWDAPLWDEPWLWFSSGHWEYYIYILTGCFQSEHPLVQSLDHGPDIFIVSWQNMPSIHY